MDNNFEFTSDTGTQVVLMMESGAMSSLWIPAVPRGRYCFEDCKKEIKEGFCIEAYEGKWYAYAISPAFFKLKGQMCSTVELSDLILFQFETENYKGAIYVETRKKDHSVFHNYFILPTARVEIGRAVDNDIVYTNPFVSRRHATLQFVNGLWKIRDHNSVNGIYVNGQNVREAFLEVGDTIYILGLRIIIGIGFLSINDCNDRVRVSDRNLHYIEAPAEGMAMQPREGAVLATPLFNRMPRKRNALSPKDLIVEGPPMSLNSNKIPLLLRMGGSMVMGGSAALTGHYTTLLSSVLFPLLTQKYTDKEKKEYEERRVESYTKYLTEKKEEIQAEKRREQEILNKNYPDIRKILSYTEERSRLWERRKVDDDFLDVRLGFGRIPLMAKVKYPDKRFQMDRDELEEQMYDMTEQPVYLEQAPIITSITQNFVCGVMGGREKMIDFIRTLILQITILHSYDEVKTIFLLEKEDLRKLEFIKYLPHAWDDQKVNRFIVTDNGEGYQISDYLKKELETDLPKPRDLKEILRERPYYVVFALNKRIFDSMEVLKEAMQSEKTCGISIIAAFDGLPKECFQLFDIKDSGTNTVTYLNEIERGAEDFVADSYDYMESVKSMKTLANTSLKLVTQAYSLPKTLTFLEMFGVGKIDHLNPVKRWQESNPVKSLATPIGIATDGSLFELDLHQKYEGPHGLVAGMTGSGKSEFILTYILSMAINYNPNEVAFILIDYKGGGLAGAFDDKARNIHLPHLVGTITNLDGPAIQRSLISIQSELKRRQRIFNEAKSISNEGTMDIYEYQKLYRQHIVEEPLPHLFIISDEFAELKQQEPEFMEQLISIARIGRSLGVHLILATQKPAGVVNDQIRSNTKFRVCLKVQDRADSMDMLNRPEAAELKETGRFYLQVGYNEFFAMGQSAWSGAPYEPQDEVVVQKDESIQFIDAVGQTIYAAKPEPTRVNTGKTQLVEIVQRLSDLAVELGIAPRQLWKEALARQLDADSLNTSVHDGKGSPVCVSIGLADDPENQKQFPLIFDVPNCRNLLVAGQPGSGKTTLLQTMILSLARRYSPEEVNFYILDYSSRLMNIFKPLPHCGAVLGEEEESSLDAFFQIINGIVAKRKTLFTELEVNSYSAANAVRPIPLILVFVDNIAGLNGLKAGEQHYFKFQEYLKAGPNYGIKYIITSSHLNESSLRMKQELGDRICLHLKDRYEYGEALGCRCSYVPPEMPGRGMALFDGVPLEIQVAKHYPDMEDKDRIQRMKQDVRSICEKYKGHAAAKGFPSVSETETYQEFMERFKKDRIPLGYSLESGKPIALPFKQFSMLSLYFGNPQGVEPVLGNFLAAAQAQSMEITVVKRKDNSCFHGQEYEADYIDLTPENLIQLWRDLVDDLMVRRELLIEYCKERGLDAARTDIYKDTFYHMHEYTTAKLLLFESFVDVCKISEEATDEVFREIFKLARQYNVYVVGCFYPDEKAMGYPLYAAFNPDELFMLFGGQFSKQTLAALPKEYRQMDKPCAYNRCLMKYREEIYPILMPCGELPVQAENEDDINIFEKEA